MYAARPARKNGRQAPGKICRRCVRAGAETPQIRGPALDAGWHPDCRAWHMTDAAPVAAAALPPAHPQAWKSASGFGFRDLLDIINPLQHIPVIGSVYRYLTGDRPGEAAQMAGDALYGGPIGVAFGLIGAATEDAKGHDLGERGLIALFGPEHGSAAATAVAAAAPPSPAPATGAQPGAKPAPAKLAANISSLGPARPPMPISLAAASRPPMPLFGGIATPVPDPNAPHVVAADPAQELAKHQAMIERSIAAGRNGPPPPRPVPLVLPPGTLPLRPSAAPLAAAAHRPPDPAQPVDIPQKMLDALDKYRAMERQRIDGAAPPAPPPGSAVDVAM